MSAQQLRDGARTDIKEQIERFKTAAVARDAEFPAMKYHAGTVNGLQIALDILDNRYRDLHG